MSETCSTLYLADALASGVMAERVAGSSGSLSWNNYLIAGGELIGMVVESSTAPTLTRYFHKDHLGSVSVITNEVGAVVERLSFDASKRSLASPRRASGASLMGGTIPLGASRARRAGALRGTRSSTRSASCT